MSELTRERLRIRWHPGERPPFQLDRWYRPRRINSYVAPNRGEPDEYTVDFDVFAELPADGMSGLTREALDIEALATGLVLRGGHLPSCGDGAEFPWDCTCDYAGFMEQMGAALVAAKHEEPPCVADGSHSAEPVSLCGNDEWDTRYECIKPEGHPVEGPGLTSHDYQYKFGRNSDRKTEFASLPDHPPTTPISGKEARNE